jgi:hypothetical protein
MNMNGRDWFIALTRVFALWVILEAIDGFVVFVVQSHILQSGNFQNFANFAYYQYLMSNILPPYASLLAPPAVNGIIGLFLLIKTETLARILYRRSDAFIRPESKKDTGMMIGK